MIKTWRLEPNRLEWRHAGRPCLIVRNDVMGNLCGYVGVPTTRATDPTLVRRLEDIAHGGITYGPEACEEGGRVCHVPLPGETEVMWFGFDCAHSGDLVPFYVDPPACLPFSFASFTYWKGAKYRDISYVRDIVNRMAEACEG